MSFTTLCNTHVQLNNVCAGLRSACTQTQQRTRMRPTPPRHTTHHIIRSPFIHTNPQTCRIHKIPLHCSNAYVVARQPHIAPHLTLLHISHYYYCFQKFIHNLFTFCYIYISHFISLFKFHFSHHFSRNLINIVANIFLNCIIISHRFHCIINNILHNIHANIHKNIHNVIHNAHSQHITLQFTLLPFTLYQLIFSHSPCPYSIHFTSIS